MGSKAFDLSLRSSKVILKGDVVEFEEVDGPLLVFQEFRHRFEEGVCVSSRRRGREGEAEKDPLGRLEGESPCSST